MANDVSFSIKVNGTQATTTTNKVRQQFYSLNDVINQTGKNITQVNQQLSTVDKTMKRPTAYDTVGRADNAMNKLGRTIKQLRVHGIDPTTNGIARFINVLGGGMFNTVTAVITAVMGLYYALKKVQQLTKDYFAALGARADTLLKISKNRVEQLKDERKEIEGVIDELKKINEKQKLNNVEKDIALTLVQKLRNMWSDVGIQIDAATGKVKNMNAIQAKLNKQNTQKTAEQLDQILKQQNNKLDLQLSKYTNKNSIFKGLFTGKNPFESLKVFNGKDINNIDIFDLFPGLIHNFDNADEVKKIDINKLLTGNTQDQISFFRQVSSHLTNIDKFNELNEIIQSLTQKLKVEKQLFELFDPSGQIVRKGDEVNKVITEVMQINKKNGESNKKLEQSRSNYQKKVEFDNMSTKQKIDSLVRQQIKLNKQYDEVEKQSRAIVGDVSDIELDDDGETWTTKAIKDIKKNNKANRQLYNQYLNIDKEYENEYNDISNTVKKLNESKRMVQAFRERQAINSGHGQPLQMSEEQKAAEQFVKTYENVINDRWSQYVEKIAKRRKEVRQSLNLSVNDEAEANKLDEQMKRFTQLRKALLGNSDLFQEAIKIDNAMQNIDTQLRKLTKQLEQETLDAIKAVQDQFDELSRIVAEEAKVTNQRKGFLTGMGNDVIAQFMRDTGQEYSLRRQQIERQIMQELGVTSLNANQKSIAGRLAYIEQLQNEQQMNDRMDTFKYGVKTNELASKGGWSSSVYVSGRDSIAQQNLKVNQNQLKIQQQIGKLLPELKKQMNTLNKNLQI